MSVRRAVPPPRACGRGGATIRQHLFALDDILVGYLGKDRIVYWGPMGCLTGNYLLVKGDLTSKDILPLMKETFEFVANFEGEVPGTTARDCGTYLLHDLPMARYEARKYVEETLNLATEENLVYPE